jgi:acetolactate synthase-1/2/3 large subunit
VSNKPYTGGVALVKALVTLGVERAFCVPGESYLPVLDALYDVSDKVDLITCRHEAGAANMAEAYGKLTGRPGICMVTRGPGAAHASIGVHTAFQDSTPMILFIGQVSKTQEDREAFQEINYKQMFGGMAKWVAQINDVNRVAEYVSRAFSTATSGRPGPVVLALPEDMLTAVSDEQGLSEFKPVRPSAAVDDVAKAVEMLANAKRPLVILGGSGWNKNAVDNYRNFAEENILPTGVAFRFQDLIDNRSPIYAGDVGIGINPELVSRVRDADVILALGPRLGEITTSGYNLLSSPKPKQSLIHVHSGAEELNSVYQADLAINSGSAEFVAQLIKLKLANKESRTDLSKADNQAYLNWIKPKPNPGAVQVAEIYKYLREYLADDAIITNGAGNYAAFLHRYFQYKSFKTQLAPTSGAMAYGVPAAIAAKAQYPNRQVVSCAGDGCFLMGSTELATAVQYKLPVVFLVFNNGMFGTIRMHQEKHFPERVSGTDLHNPNFVAMAKAFGANGALVSRTKDFAPAFEAAIKADMPTVIEIEIDKQALSHLATLDEVRELGQKNLRDNN